MTKKHAAHALAYLGFLLLPFSGCSTAPKVPSGIIAGREVARTSLVLTSQQEVRLRDGRRMVLPSGVYRPIKSNEDGVFFESPSIPVMFNHFFGREFSTQNQTGGIYLEREQQETPMVYLRAPKQGSELAMLLAGVPFTFPIKDGERIDFTFTTAQQSTPQVRPSPSSIR